ncbi:Formyl-coenzyme A transferase [Fusarium pseudocircinatum]|uniref:Formyl-coenzyme A transferase n=1 Tax=Fusarium pseudocircinatum TaxID=56676 RepID=A0A8H5KW26_9HYPO|nr:Formyl-coenzyme A transferase [Fusarium pseudocircinatum]
MEVAEFSILTPNAMLGYGYNVEHFWYGVQKFAPAAIIVDSGSTDGGPYKLGMNKMTCGRGSYIRDLEPILTACFHHKLKVLIGSVGGDGSNKHVQEMFEIVSSVSERLGFSFKIATINAGMNRDLIKSRIQNHKVSPCGPVEELLPDVVDGAVDVVAQMGAEPFLEALQGNPDIILGGRCYDPAPFAAFCLSKGISSGVAWHMGKIMECGGICAIPKGRSMIATMRYDSFDLTPLAPEERCTPLSVAAHTLYEKTRPDRLPGPGGVLSLDSAKYEQITDKTTRVSGAQFLETPYQVKLEGVTFLGYRTIFIGGIRDPILISQIDEFLERVRKYTQNLFPELDQSDSCRLIYHVYGKNGVMGPLETQAVGSPHEIAVLGEVVAPTQDMAYTIANNARASILHFSYPGQIATTGNFASPLSPHEQDAGAVFKFSLYHLVDLEAGEASSLFPITFRDINSSASPSPALGVSGERLEALENGTLAPIEKKQVPSRRAKMQELARIIRSKNSGPFEMTFDIMFDDDAVYRRVRDAKVLTNDVIRSLYQVENSDILTNMFFEPALAWKCTIKRPWAQGSVGERDTLGTQQHALLLGIEVPEASPKRGITEATHAEVAHANGVNGVECVDKINGVNGLTHVPQPSLSGHFSSTASSSFDRSSFLSRDVVHDIWNGLSLPPEALKSLELPGDDGKPALPSSYKIGTLAQGTIALSGLLAALIHSLRNQGPVSKVTVPKKHSVIEFKSERLYILNGKPAPSPWGPIGGLHKTSDGYVRIHDSFPNHRYGALELLGLPVTASRIDVTKKTQSWASIDLESVGLERRLAVYALRSYRQWDMLPQSKAIDDFPISLTRIASGPAGLSPRLTPDNDKCLRGLRVVEMSRVIAAPLAGKTLAAHGADVIWITSPTLPDLPTMDRDFGRGKRTVHIDINDVEDRQKLRELIKSCDVFIQGFRPGSLAAKGFSPEEVADLNPGIIYGCMSAFGPKGPWSGRRGYDSLIQTCSGMNVSEAAHYGAGEAARPTPCQALDHAGGYLLASGIMAALYRRSVQGRSYLVDVSLAGAMKYLRSMGQYPGKSGFEAGDYEKPSDVEEYLETRQTGFGEMRAVRHSVSVDGAEPGWDVMPKPLGSDDAQWLQLNGDEMEAIVVNSENSPVASPSHSETTSVQRRRRLDQHQHSRSSNRRDSRRYGLIDRANTRIQELESALEKSQKQNERLSGENRNATASGATNVVQDNVSPAGSMPLLGRRGSTYASPSDARSNTIDATIWSQVGIGEDGSITYNGPTSRFHAGSLAGNGPSPSTTQAIPGSAQDIEIKSSHVERLRSQYDLLDTVWIPLAKSKSMTAFGITNEMGWQILDMYWTWLHPLHNCIYRPVFLMDMALNGTYYSDFLLMAIFALAARHLSRQEGDSVDSNMGERFFTRAKMLLMDELDNPKPRIPTIQGLLILGGRQCAIGKSSQGWLFTGMAIRMMVDIGIHLNANRIAELERLTPSEIETRKRLYNSAFIWDKTLSLALGRPPSLTGSPYSPDEIFDHYDDDREWRPSVMDITDSAYDPTPMYNTATFCAFCQLHVITTDMMLLLFDRGHSENIYPEIDHISNRLTAWYNELPTLLKINEGMTQCPPPHIASLKNRSSFLYHALHILLLRPLLHSPEISIRNSSLQTCVNHSKRIHAIHDLYTKSFPHRLMTYQVSYCVYTAATVDVLDMRRSEAGIRIDAARRLGMAVRTLQEEAKHTPGSGRSLDTIRRQLTVWEVSGPPNTSQQEPRQGSAANLAGGAQPVALNRTEGHQTSPHPVDAEVENGGLQAVNEGASGFLSRYQSPFSFGMLDTGAGFHPDSFPWDMTEIFGNSQAYGASERTDQVF